MALISDEELDRILAECREEMKKHEAYLRILREAPPGFLETMDRLAPMVSIPDLLPRENRLHELDEDLSGDMSPVSEDEYARILKEARSKIRPDADFSRMTKAELDSRMERMAPMVSIPSRPRAATDAPLPELQRPCSKQASPAPSARPQRAAFYVSPQIDAILIRGAGVFFLAVIFAAVAWDVVEQVRAASAAWDAIGRLQEMWSPYNFRHFLPVVGFLLAGIGCLELAKRVPRAR